ncbi:stage II sporulation protein M [Leptolyngbya sp. NK1-12]|uniref:Stage II sporulation protein M n=1 Tax=Leptolyngbya sp. NK1-12 TaxID=2547451 RepID=A0AA96WBF9_9CYAN|nr:stage II sporulation protein M [Leptolyngbya sp. NK1-12]WNZ21979.1 stage II sporulation protein M [Leptolyngbya sp. NK1-12]
MNIQRWIARREQSWKQLDTLLNQVEKRGLKSLSAGEIQTLASLYRSVAADLARARTQQVGDLVVRNLQALATRAYSQIYQGSRQQEWNAVREFYRWGFPAVVQRSRGYIALAIGLFGLAAVVSWWLAWRDPTFLALVVPSELISQVRDRQELWTGSIVGIEPFASSSIMINNIRVSFMAVAGGITAGLLTTYVVLINGVLLGTIGALVGQNNLAFPFWAFVFPHGSLELPAIFLAVAAGFLIARAILFPGQYRRVDALKLYGQQAAQLVFGIVPLLVIAGAIEGFFSPSPLVPNPIKYLVGIGLLVGLIYYFNQRK